MAADNFTFNDVENFSQEIRLTSDDSFRLPWIVGANYAKTDIDWFQTIDLTALAGSRPATAPSRAPRPGRCSAISRFRCRETFDFIGGLRYTTRPATGRARRSSARSASLDEALASGAPRLSQLPLPDGDPGQGGPLDFPTSLDEDKVDFQAVLKFKPNDDAMYYAERQRGVPQRRLLLGGDLLAGSARALRSGDADARTRSA